MAKFLRSARSENPIVPGPRPLTAAQLVSHPEYPHADLKLVPTRCGKANVGQKSRGGRIKLFYEIHGTGPIKIVFIIGLGLLFKAWQRQTKFFGHDNGTEYSCLVFDNRGLGQSSKSFSKFTTSVMAMDTIELLNQIGWIGERELNIVGVSMGGMIAQEMAMIIPSRICSLSLVCTGSRMLNPEGFLDTFMRRAMLFLPRSLDEHLRVLKANLYTDTWLRAPDEITPVVRPFPSNGDRFGASEVLKKTNSEVFTNTGFLLQAIATQVHKKSSKELEWLADHVGRSRIMVVHGGQDEMMHFAHGVVLAAGLGLISKRDESSDWSARQDEYGWGNWGNWKVNTDRSTNTDYMVKFAQGQSHALIVELQDEFHKWVQEIIRRGLEANERK